MSDTFEHLYRRAVDLHAEIRHLVDDREAILRIVQVLIAVRDETQHETLDAIELRLRNGDFH